MRAWSCAGRRAWKKTGSCRRKASDWHSSRWPPCGHGSTRGPSGPEPMAARTAATGGRCGCSTGQPCQHLPPAPAPAPVIRSMPSCGRNCGKRVWLRLRKPTGGPWRGGSTLTFSACRRPPLNQIKTQLTANELASCIGIIQDLLEELNKSHFTLAVQLCSNAALGLSRISTNREFTSEESTRLANAVDDLKLIYDKVEELRREKKRGQISKQAHSKLNEMVVTLGQIQGRLRSQVREFEP
jgi:hypothetical protein